MEAQPVSRTAARTESSLRMSISLWLRGWCPHKRRRSGNGVKATPAASQAARTGRRPRSCDRLMTARSFGYSVLIASNSNEERAYARLRRLHRLLQGVENLRAEQAGEHLVPALQHRRGLRHLRHPARVVPGVRVRLAADAAWRQADRLRAAAR